MITWGLSRLIIQDRQSHKKNLNIHHINYRKTRQVWMHAGSQVLLIFINWSRDSSVVQLWATGCVIGGSSSGSG
jgi:cyanophycinase-like exopeptidase